MTRRRTHSLDNADRAKRIVQRLFPRVQSFLREDRSSCTVESGVVFTHEELKRAGGRLKAHTAPDINGVPNKVLKEAIAVYPEILLEAFNFCLRVGRFFEHWKKQRLVLLKIGEKPLDKASSYGPICLLVTMGKMLEDSILQRFQSRMEGENNLSENQFGFWKGSSTVDAIRSALTYAMRSILQDGRTASKR